MLAPSSLTLELARVRQDELRAEAAVHRRRRARVALAHDAVGMLFRRLAAAPGEPAATMACAAC